MEKVKEKIVGYQSQVLSIIFKQEITFGTIIYIVNTLQYLVEVHALLQILSFFPTLHAVNRSCTFLSFSKKFYPALLLYPAHFEMDLKESVIYNLSRSKYLLDVAIYDEPCNQIWFFFNIFPKIMYLVIGLAYILHFYYIQPYPALF